VRSLNQSNQEKINLNFSYFSSLKKSFFWCVFGLSRVQLKLFLQTNLLHV